MDDDLLRRVEALEKEVARLSAWQPVPPPPPPAQPGPPSGPPAGARKPAWRLGSAAGNQADLESRIGGKWLAIAGITLLVIAVVFFFQLAVDRGWIGLAEQVVLGALFGLALWGAGIAMAAKQKLTGFAQVVSAGGVAIAAFAVFVGHHVEAYQAATGLGLLTDSVLLGVLGLAAAADAGLRRVPVQAGAATGLVVWTSLAGLDTTGFSLAYTVFMVAALLAVGVWRAWPWMASTAAPASALVLSVHLVDGTDARWVFAAVVLVHVLIVSAAARLRAIDAGTIVGHVVAWASFWVLGGLALVGLSDGETFAWWSLVVAFIGYAVSFLVHPRELRLAAAIPATVAALAAPLFIEADAARIPIWLALFLAAEVLRRLKHWTTSLSVRPVILVAVIIHATTFEVDNLMDRAGPWVTDIMVLSLVAAAAVVAWHGERRAKANDLLLPLVNLGLGLLVLLIMADAIFEGPTTSVVWALVAIALVVTGFVLDEAQLRVAGLAVFAAVLIRIVAVDLAGVDAIWRVLAFMGIAALLLLASWMYVRNAAKKPVE